MNSNSRKCLYALIPISLLIILTMTQFLLPFQKDIPTLFDPLVKMESTGNMALSKHINIPAIMKHLRFIHNLQNFERKVHSQNGEDGVIEYIFQNMGTKDKYYVEFGTQDASECVTKHLWERYGWDGLLIDGSGKTNDARVIRNHFITAESIVPLFQQYNVPLKFDFLSVDIDRNDFYVGQAILEAGYRPVLLSFEVNRNFEVHDSYTVEYEADKVWQGDAFFGVSPQAITHLAKKYGYDVIYYDHLGVNMFFIQRTALLEYLAEKTGQRLAEHELDDFLPTYESIFRATQSLHVTSLKEFKDEFASQKLVKVNPDASITKLH